MSISVSIVVPHYEDGQHLQQCVESVVASCTALPFEVIVVDDGSASTTALETLVNVEKTENVSVVRHGQRLGTQTARNTGLQNAEGTYLMTLDADDMLVPGSDYPHLASRLLDADENIAFVHSRSEMMGEASGLTISSYPITAELLARKHHVLTPIVFRRSTYASGARYDESMPKWQDWAFGIEVLGFRLTANEGILIGFVPGPAHGYRIHPFNERRVSRSDFDELSCTLQVVEKHRSLFRSLGVGSDDMTDAELAQEVLAYKPTRLKDLLLMANYDLPSALDVMERRDFRDLSCAWDALDVP